MNLKKCMLLTFISASALVFCPDDITAAQKQLERTQKQLERLKDIDPTNPRVKMLEGVIADSKNPLKPVLIENPLRAAAPAETKPNLAQNPPAKTKTSLWTQTKRLARAGLNKLKR
jgi:hypothetical protein